MFMLDALSDWKDTFSDVYLSMFEPIIAGVKKENDKLVASELKYYLNCNTCQELVRLIRKSPND